jgi:hypothetical protein
MAPSARRKRANGSIIPCNICDDHVKRGPGQTILQVALRPVGQSPLTDFGSGGTAGGPCRAGPVTGRPVFTVKLLQVLIVVTVIRPGPTVTWHGHRHAGDGDALPV